MSVNKTAQERLFERVQTVLTTAQIDPLVIKRVHEQFFPPTVTGLLRPQKRHFRAAVLQPRAQCFVRADNRSYWFELANVIIEADKDYRLVELNRTAPGDPDWVLMIAPKYMDTIAIKNQIFHLGWDVMLQDNPEIELRQMGDLDIRERFGAFPLEVPRIFYSRHKVTGNYREGGIVYPRRQTIA